MAITNLLKVLFYCMKQKINLKGSKMLKKTGVALLGILLIVAAVAVLTGVATHVLPAIQLSDVAQKFIEPSKAVSTFPITTLGSLKNKKQRLEVIKATVEIVDKEMTEKTEQSQQVYDYLTPVAAALLSLYLTNLYKNRTMYSEAEVKEIKNSVPPTVTAVAGPSGTSTVS
jgi:hypothetical protein